jgi:hypothetical protein
LFEKVASGRIDENPTSFNTSNKGTEKSPRRRSIGIDVNVCCAVMFFAVHVEEGNRKGIVLPLSYGCRYWAIEAR